MNRDEQAYLDLLKHILENGADRKDRTGIGTVGIFGTQLRFSLENNRVPMLTTKKMFTKGIIEELLFFIRGETDTKKLEAKGVNIWKGNTTREFLDSRGLTDYPEGEMGPMYGFQWRNFGKTKHWIETDESGENKYIEVEGIDQLKNALNLIKFDPYSRRILVTAYNPSASSKCVLDPCHMFFQFHVENGKLNCQWYQRSVDLGLGFPFNVLSYAILTKLMANAANLDTGELIFTGGDTHIYNNHLSQIKEQITRIPFEFPTMKIKKEINFIEDMEKLSYEDFEIENYVCHPTIKMPMAI